MLFGRKRAEQRGRGRNISREQNRLVVGSQEKIKSKERMRRSYDVKQTHLAINFSPATQVIGGSSRDGSFSSFSRSIPTGPASCDGVFMGSATWRRETLFFSLVHELFCLWLVVEGSK